MPSEAPSPSTTTTSAVPRPGSAGRERRGGNGQWLVDGRTPLNHNEEVKAADDGLNVRQRIEDVYSRRGFASIDPDDLNARFRWWGLYTQRRPGIEGGRTAQLSAQELSDEFFMLRVRIDGGALTTDQLRTVADVSTEFARDSADLTDRQNVQLHWVRVEDVPEIWRRLEAVGLSTTEACGDVPRVVLGSPVAGIAREELLDATPVVREIVDRFIGDPELANLPRKFKSAVTGHPSLDVVHEINDISFVAVEHERFGLGYDVWVGGGLSTSAHLAQRLGAFVTPAEAPEVWRGVVRLFRDYGYRRLRSKARLKYLVKDWGVERFREVLEREYLGRPLPDGPPPAPARGRGDHVGVHEQKDGRLYVGLSPTVGRVSGTTLRALADAAEGAGSGRVRLTAHQKVVVLDVDPARLDAFLAATGALGLTAFPSPFRRSTIACTGIEFCKLAIVETKAAAAAAAAELERRLAGIELDPPLTLHVNGCPNSCARIQTADIGLKGQLVQDEDGRQVPGFQVHLGGGLASAHTQEAGTGRTVRGLKVTADGLADYVERVTRRYLDTRDPGESFASWAHRSDEEELR